MLQKEWDAPVINSETYHEQATEGGQLFIHNLFNCLLCAVLVVGWTTSSGHARCANNPVSGLNGYSATQQQKLGDSVQVLCFRI